MSLCNNLMTPKPMETKSAAFRSFRTPIAISQRLRVGWECVVKVPVVCQPCIHADDTPLATPGSEAPHLPIVAGELSAKEIAHQIKTGGGKATLTSVQGGTLTAMKQGGKLVLTDEKGGTSTVTIANVIQFHWSLQGQGGRFR